MNIVQIVQFVRVNPGCALHHLHPRWRHKDPNRSPLTGAYKTALAANRLIVRDLIKAGWLEDHSGRLYVARDGLPTIDQGQRPQDRIDALRARVRDRFETVEKTSNAQQAIMQEQDDRIVALEAVVRDIWARLGSKSMVGTDR